ncbi:MAG: YbaN family protein [Acidimicrobiia bacterium]
MAVVKNRALRVLLLALGFAFLGLAFIGIAVPGLPTTGPVLLAAFLFSKSSERFDNWLVTNRLFGTIVQDWRAGRGFSVRGKTIAIVAIAISFGITTIFFVDNIYLRVALWLLAIGIAIYILTRPTKRADSSDAVSAEQAPA